MKVAVTGGTGSWDRGIGPVVIAALKAKGYEVTNLDRAVPGGIERPGFIKTERIAKSSWGMPSPEAEQAFVSALPLRRAGKPDDIAGVVAILCSDAGSYV